MSDTIRALTETVRGRVITASDPGHDDARAVVAGPLFYDFDDATAVLECYRSFINEAPEQLGASSGGGSRLLCRSSPKTGSGICPACWSRAGTVPMSRPSRCSGHCAMSPRCRRSSSR